MSADSRANTPAPAGAETPGGPQQTEQKGGLPRWVALLGIAALVVAAVGLAPHFDLRGGSGEPIPADVQREQGTPSIPDPAEAGVEGATTEEEVVAGVLRYEMESQVLEQAAMDLPTSSECTSTSETEYECTVTIDDQPVRSTIEVGEVTDMNVSSGGKTMIDTSSFQYTVLEQEVVVTDHAVHLAMHQMLASSQDIGTPLSDPRSDEDLPALQVVPEGEEAEGACYAQPNGWRAWPNWSTTITIEGNSPGPSVWHD